MSEREYLIALSTFISFGPVRTALLIKYFKTAKKIWEVSQNELLKVGLGIKTVENFIEHRNNFDIHKYLFLLQALAKPV